MVPRLWSRCGGIPLHLIRVNGEFSFFKLPVEVDVLFPLALWYMIIIRLSSIFPPNPTPTHEYAGLVK